MPPADMLAGLNATSRDHARTPMQWSAAPGAGFTTWDAVDRHQSRSYDGECAGRGSRPDVGPRTLKALIALRRADRVLREGRYRDLDTAHPGVYIFERTIGRERRLIAINLSSKQLRYTLPAGIVPGKRLIGDATVAAHTIAFEPWQAAIWRCR